MSQYKGFIYTPAPKTAWDNLPLAAKAEMMKVAVRKGITNLQTIRQKYNEFAEGGKAEIHIKPENRGKFTALKERTGHSATWFKEHGTPAQKKMATFELNARKWKHGEGGNLFEKAGQMQIGRDYWQSQTPQPFFNLDFPINGGTLQEIVVTGSKDKYDETRRKRLAEIKEVLERQQNEYQTESNDNTWVETPLTYRKKNPHLKQRVEKGAKAHVAWEKEHPNLTAWSNALGAVPFAVAAYPLAATAGSGIAALGDAAAATSVGQGLTNILAPVAASTIAGAPALEWANAGLSSLSAAHGASQAIEDGGISPMTAFEMVPMLQVAKPMVNEAALAVENYRYPFGRPQALSEEENFIPNFFFRRKGTITEKSVLKDLSEAKNYKESDSYKSLAESFLKETGETDIPVDVFYNSRHLQFPSIILEKRPRNLFGGYTYSKNKISIDPKQASDDTPFHEGLHWQRISNPEVEMGPDYEAWLKAYNNNAPKEITAKLWDKFFYSEIGQKALKQERAIDALYKRKVKEVVYPDAPKDSEMWRPAELTAHPFGIGKSLGLKPFQEYPGLSKALEIIKKARKKDSYLYDIKAGSEKEVKNFWKLLTGNYMPVTIGGVSTIGFTVSNNSTE